MTESDILVMTVGSSVGVEECVTTGPFGPMAACLPSLSGLKDMDHHILERLHQVLCVTNRKRQQPTHKLENDNPWDECCSLRCAVKRVNFYFYCTSERPLCYRHQCGRLGG